MGNRDTKRLRLYTLCSSLASIIEQHYVTDDFTSNDWEVDMQTAHC